MDDPDELDRILDKIRNRWETDLTAKMSEPIEERDNEEPSRRDVPKRANRSRKSKQRYRNRK